MKLITINIVNFQMHFSALIHNFSLTFFWTASDTDLGGSKFIIFNHYTLNGLHKITEKEIEVVFYNIDALIAKFNYLLISDFI